MAIIVQKYGGTSVGSLERIEIVADHIIATRRQGHQVVVVLSAMAGETNRLLSMAKVLDKQPATRELDMLLASAEQVSISLLTLALIQRGFSAISLLAHQVAIHTNNQFGRARIQSVNSTRLLQALEQEQIAVVAGFQGQDSELNITTLGRGGSDTSAVAIAVAIQANECQIFTDVDGIYSADPRIESDAHKLPTVTFDEMLVMANLGAKVLQNRAVEFAMKHDMPIRVLSSFKLPNNIGLGTKVMNEAEMNADEVSQNAIINIAHQNDQVLVSIVDIIDQSALAELITIVGNAGIEIDMLSSQQQNNCNYSVKFSVCKSELVLLYEKLQEIAQKKHIGAIQCHEKVAKISAIGIGLKSHANIVGQFISALTAEHIPVLLFSTSEISISVLVEDDYLVKSVHKLHKTFLTN